MTSANIYALVICFINLSLYAFISSLAPNEHSAGSLRLILVW